MPKPIAHHLAVPYIRLSPRDEDKKTGLGVEAQRAGIVEFAEKHNIVLLDFCEDLDVSGKTPLEKRPELLRGLDLMRDHRAGKLLVHKRDRLSRDTFVAKVIEHEVEQLGGVVWAAAGTSNERTPEAKFMRDIQDAVSAYEREQIRARTILALHEKRKRGECIGQVPYGFQANMVEVEGKLCRRQLVPNAAEQAVIETMRTLRARGLSFRGIANYLNSEGVPSRPRTGKKYAGIPTRWQATTIFRVLKT